MLDALLATLVNGLVLGGDPFAVSPDGALAPERLTTWMEPRPVTCTPAPPDIAAGGSLVTSFLSTDELPEGDLPRDLAYTPDGTQLVVVNRITDNLVFFDVDTRTITATVQVGDFPTDVAVTPDGRYAITPNAFGHSISIVDVATHTLLGEVPLSGEQPFQVAVTSDSAHAIVALINDGIASSFSVVDLAAQSEVLSFPSGPQGVIGFFFTPESGISGNLFTQFALAPDDSTLVLPDRGNSRVLIYDPLTGDELAALPTAAEPLSVDISLDSSIAVLGHEGSVQRISEIDLAGLAVVGNHATGVNLTSQVIRITPDKSHAIAAISNNVIFVDLVFGFTSATLPTGVVGDIELSFDGQYAFVTNFESRLIDIATRTQVDSYPLAACVDAAASPVELRAAALNNRFREDVHFYDIDGPAGFVEGIALSGEIDEGDATRTLALSADGTVAVACNNTSRNVAIVDVAGGFVRSYVDVGERPLDVAIAPDGSCAVVCAADANQVVVIDLGSDVVVATLPIFNRPARVRIAPDSQHAYVLNVAGTDRITFIELAGAASTIVAQVSAGQTGSSLGYTYTEVSGIELSPDGSILGVCDSFNDFLRLYDTATMSQVDAVPVGDFPIRVAFSADGTRAYVANAFGDSLSIVEVDGPSSSVIGTVGGIEFPLTIDPDDAGSFVYVGNTDGGSPGVHIISTASNSQVGFVPLAAPARDSHLENGSGTLYLGTTGAELVRVAAAGAGSSVIDSTPLTSGPSDMVFDETSGTALLAQPIPDGIDFVGPRDTSCPADIDGDGQVSVVDLVEVITNWNQPGPHADVNLDGVVNVADLVEVILAWGAC